MSVLDRPMFGSSETEIAQGIARQEELLKNTSGPFGFTRGFVNEGLGSLESNAVEPSQSTSLGPNQFRLGNKIYTIGPDFEEKVRTRQVDGMTLYPIINAPGAEFGSNVERILREFVATDEPFKVSETFGEGFESRGSFFQPEDIGSAFQSTLRGAGKLLEAPARGLAGFVGEFTGGQKGKEQFQSFVPEMSTDLEFAQQRAEQLGLKDFSAEIEKIAPSPTPAPEPTPAPKINMGASQFELDEANKAIQEELGEIGSNIEVPSADEEVTTEIKAEDVDLKDKKSVDKYVDQQIRKDRANVNYFSSPKFLSFVRNLSSALTSEMQMGSGLAKGASAFAEEQAARDLMREQAALEKQAKIEELLLEASLKGQDPLKVSDVSSITKMGSDLNQNMKEFEGNQAAVALMNDAISLFEEALATGQPVTGLPGRFARFTDQAQAFFGQDPEESAATKIYNIIEIIKNQSIRDILNESGRTISNLDRQIVDRVFGELNLTGDPSEILKKLKNSRSRLVESAEEKQRNIRNYRQTLLQPSVRSLGANYVYDVNDVIEKILNANVKDFSQPSLNEQTSSSIINIALRE